MSKRIAGIAMAAALAVAAVGTPVAADKTGEDVLTIDEPPRTVFCDGGTELQLTERGWLDFGKPWLGFKFKVRRVYTNTATGDKWHFSDTGIIKFTPPDTGALSGRSVGLGDDVVRIGHVVIQFVDGGDDIIIKQAGRVLGPVDDMACDKLTS